MSDALPEHLKRVLPLSLVVLYGFGITIGAGIYVLVGETAGRAGMLAPLSFLVGAIVMLFPALCSKGQLPSFLCRIRPSP